MSVNMTPLSHCALASNNHQFIANDDGRLIDSIQFHSDVKKLASGFLNQPSDDFAIYYEQAYSFCVCLFALLHSGKQIWIAANNKQATAELLAQQGCMLVGDWQGKEMVVDQANTEELFPLNSNEKQITIFTSGSSGQAKAIKKSLQQFQYEIDALEKIWGYQLRDSQVLGTVSHQHIYGLLFRVLWPLAAGRCFHSEMYLSPESLLNASKKLPACWVASPAQLKRLDDLTQWSKLEKLGVIFSSGGALSTEVAIKIAQQCRHKVLEIYGSSETGGIAWRKSVDDELWLPFNGITMTEEENGRCYLLSPYLSNSEKIVLDDKIQLGNDGRFSLQGRVDRIVKVEEKRLSLESLESRLNRLNWVQQTHVLLLTGKRDTISAVLVLSDAGKLFLSQEGRGKLVRRLRKQLMTEFETVVLPRKWLFISELPVNSQGKINQGLLAQLFSLKKTHTPQILSCDFQDEVVGLDLRVPADLVYFLGHFPEQPILPGVTQLAWVEQFGQLFFNINLPFLRMEAIKFKHVIRPDELVRMTLRWKAASNKLYFELTSENASHSSGRLVYGERE